MYSLSYYLARSIPIAYDALVWMIGLFGTFVGDRDVASFLSSNGLRVRMRRNIFTGHEAMYLSRDLRVFFKLNSSDVLVFYRIGVSNGDWSRLVGRCVYEEIPVDGSAACESGWDSGRVIVRYEHQIFSMLRSDVIEANRVLLINGETVRTNDM